MQVLVEFFANTAPLVFLQNAPYEGVIVGVYVVGITVSNALGFAVATVGAYVVGVTVDNALGLGVEGASVGVLTGVLEVAALVGEIVGAVVALVDGEVDKVDFFPCNFR